VDVAQTVLSNELNVVRRVQHGSIYNLREGDWQLALNFLNEFYFVILLRTVSDSSHSEQADSGRVFNQTE
jgi:hypothetical protein